MPSISDLYLTFAAIRAKDWCAERLCENSSILSGLMV